MHRIEAGKTRIGWIGTGVMGRWMCKHIMDRGFAASVYSRTREKTAPLVAEGADWAETPAAVAAASDVIFSMVGTPEDVTSVYFGEAGILAAPTAGKILVDMTTTRPSLAEEIFRAAAAKDAHALDAPVSGGDVGAREARLSIMVGGSRDIFEAVAPLFDMMGQTIVYQGGAGAGQHAKMCNQIMIAGTMIGMCESLLYGRRAGLDLETMLAGISGGAAACWALDNLAPRMLRNEFDTGFFVEHFVKDMGIALDEARRMHLALPGLALVEQLYHMVMAEGGGRLGTQALMLSLARMSRVES